VKLSQLINRPEDVEPPIQLVGGHYFFCRTVELPEEMEAEALEAFAELSVEELSPFPLEQLAWGYLLDADGRQLFIYAACRPRIPGEEQSGWEAAEQVYPAFLPMLLSGEKRERWALLKADNSLTLMHFTADSSLPRQTASAPLPEEPSEQEQALARLRTRCGLPADALLEHWQLLRITASREAITFTLKLEADGTEQATRLHGEMARWRADLRDADFMVGERRRRRLEQRVAWAMLGVGLAASLMLLLSLLAVFGSWLVERRQALVESKSEAVFTIQQNSDFLLQLEQFSGDPFQPFRVLEIANSILMERQPREITFDSAALANNEEVVIQGTSKNVDAVNRYSDALRASGFFTMVDLVDVRTRRGDVNFTLNLRFDTQQTLAANDVGEEATQDDA